MLFKGKLRAQLDYECVVCGKRRLGQTQTVTFYSHTPEGLAHTAETLKPTSAYMPVGWGRDERGFYCQCTSTLPE